jgi:glutathionylspermidine synthase
LVSLKKVNPISNSILEEIGFNWHTDNDGSAYMVDELVNVTSNEAEAYYKAGNEIYDMLVETCDYVIENDLFFELGIPFNLIDTIKKSWESDVHWHLYGRFDFAGGIDGKPIKLIEFNADTPTGLFETAILQWALLKENNLDEDKQFNKVYEAIQENFKRLITMDKDTSDFKKHYDGWKILFSSIEGNDEEEKTVRLLQMMANDVEFINDFEFLDKVKFDEDGIFNENEDKFEYWFKLFPWEDIGVEEGELATILDKIMQNQEAIILNPAYTLLMQSKGILKIMYDLFPDSPYLLACSFEPLNNIKQVEKKVFGREGSNTKIIQEDGTIDIQTQGEYEHYKSIFQEFVEFPKDDKGNYYQAGVFFAYESCGLAYRRGGKILDNMSKFVGHRLV